MTNKPLPNSLEAEKGILGSILLEQGGKPLDIAIANGLTEESFTDDKNRMVFGAIKSVSERDVNPDPVTVINTLRADSDAVDIAYVQSLIDQTPISTHSEYYIGIVIEKHKLRNIIIRARAIEKEALDGKIEIDASMICDKASEDFVDINESHGKAVSKRTFKQTCGDVVKMIEDNASGVAPMTLLTNIGWIDDSTGGILDAAYWVITGEPGAFKTTLCRQISQSIASAGKRVCVKSTEQTSDQYAEGMMASDAQISVKKLHEHGLHDKYLNRLRESETLVSGYKIEIDDGVGTKSQWKTWYKKCVKADCALMVFDYLQMVEGETKDEIGSNETRVTNASGALVGCAKKTLVPCMVVATLNKEGTIKYSNNVTYDATVIIHLRKADGFHPIDDPHVIARFAKARFSAGELEVDLYYWFGRLLEKQEYEDRKSALFGDRIRTSRADYQEDTSGFKN